MSERRASVSLKHMLDAAAKAVGISDNLSREDLDEDRIEKLIRQLKAVLKTIHE